MAFNLSDIATPFFLEDMSSWPTMVPVVDYDDPEDEVTFSSDYHIVILKTEDGLDIKNAYFWSEGPKWVEVANGLNLENVVAYIDRRHLLRAGALATGLKGVDSYDASLVADKRVYDRYRAEGYSDVPEVELVDLGRNP